MLGSAFDDLDPRLSLRCQVGDMSSAPAKSVGDARYASQDPFIQSMMSQLQSVLGVHSFYVERNKAFRRV